ncbi:MAG: hypothetical protein ABIQ11_06560, partial [Saprospiraceae bacterium]
MRTAKYILPLAGLLLITGFILFLSKRNSHSNSSPTHPNVEEKELLPNDWLYRQRAYPSGSIDEQAYFKALEYKSNLLKEKISTRGSAPWIFSGPTNIGGRVTDIELQQTIPPSIIVGTASGGIFKTNDEGQTWIPIFDSALNLSIGDLSVAKSNQDIIYVGTGEANAGGGSIAYDGNGIYKSLDGGDNWIHLGLDSIGSVGKMQVHPADPDQCYVAAMGYLFENNPNRGLYKTNDGGETWENILFINDSTGVIDFAINPDDPNIMYAASWERIRRVNRRAYGGPSSGIHKSIDGGNTWNELTNGLPQSAGRIAIALAESNPEILYAIYAHETSGYIQGLFKSVDGGDSWFDLDYSDISEQPYMWWFGKIFVDPQDADIVYLPSFTMHKSEDGGLTWFDIFEGAHVDQHSICFDPLNPGKVYAGNDGGVYLSYDGGLVYEQLNGLPNIQFYTCEIDYQFPNRLYGGAQDNGTNRTLGGNEDDWHEIYGGDGFRVLVDPTDNNYIYAEFQYAGFGRSKDGGYNFDYSTSGIFFGDRKNWNTAFELNPVNPSTLYLGTNRLYKSTNRGEMWELLSADLTRNTTQHNIAFGTITSISISPLDTNLIYIGTDDGNVQVSKNGSNSWTLISGSLPDRWVTSVVSDPENINTAYVTFSGFRFGENIGHIYKTINQGSSWTDISANLPDIPINDLIVT